MNKSAIYILPICLVFSSCAISPTNTPEVSKQFVANGYQIETIASQYAYPSHIQIESVEKGLMVKGQIIRQSLFKTMHIRGHVDVEVLDTQNQLISGTAIPLKHSIVHAKHDRRRAFSVVIPGDVPKEYRIRVRHNIGTQDHLTK